MKYLFPLQVNKQIFKQMNPQFSRFMSIQEPEGLVIGSPAILMLSCLPISWAVNSNWINIPEALIEASFFILLITCISFYLNHAIFTTAFQSLHSALVLWLSARVGVTSPSTAIRKPHFSCRKGRHTTLHSTLHWPRNTFNKQGRLDWIFRNFQFFFERIDLKSVMEKRPIKRRLEK